jgi:hypothetical protein
MFVIGCSYEYSVVWLSGRMCNEVVVAWLEVPLWYLTEVATMYVSDDNQPPGMNPGCMYTFMRTPQAYHMNLCCGNRVTCTAY